MGTNQFTENDIKVLNLLKHKSTVSKYSNLIKASPELRNFHKEEGLKDLKLSRFYESIEAEEKIKEAEELKEESKDRHAQESIDKRIQRFIFSLTLPPPDIWRATSLLNFIGNLALENYIDELEVRHSVRRQDIEEYIKNESVNSLSFDENSEENIKFFESFLNTSDDENFQVTILFRHYKDKKSYPSFEIKDSQGIAYSNSDPTQQDVKDVASIKQLKNYNKKVILDLEEFPELKKEWDYSKNKDENPNEISLKTKQWWVCKNEHSWNTSIIKRVENETKCPYCAPPKLKILINFDSIQNFEEEFNNIINKQKIEIKLDTIGKRLQFARKYLAGLTQSKFCEKIRLESIKLEQEPVSLSDRAIAKWEKSNNNNPIWLKKYFKLILSALTDNYIFLHVPLGAYDYGEPYNFLGHWILSGNDEQGITDDSGNHIPIPDFILNTTVTPKTSLSERDRTFSYLYNTYKNENSQVLNKDDIKTITEYLLEHNGYSLIEYMSNLNFTEDEQKRIYDISHYLNAGEETEIWPPF